MNINGRRYSHEEFRSRATAIYDKIRQQVDPGNKGKILAIDIESGEYEVSADQIEAVETLFARLPDPQVYCFRIGYQAVHSFGGSIPEIAS